MATEENKVVVRRLLEAIWEGDLAALDAHPGLQDMQRMLPLVRAAFPDFGGTIERQIAEGDMVATHALCHGTHRGTFMGIAPTGMQVSFQSVSVDRVVDGKVVQRNSELGWLDVLLQLGVLPLDKHSERGENRSLAPGTSREGQTMAIGVIFEGAGVSQAQYEQVKNKVAPGNKAAPGMLYHVAGPTEKGWCVVEVWESQEALDQFFQQGLGKAMQEANINIQPRPFQVFNTMKP